MRSGGLFDLFDVEIGVRLTERGRMLGNEVFLRFLRDEMVSES
jgi:hypothetical protein